MKYLFAIVFLMLATLAVRAQDTTQVAAPAASDSATVDSAADSLLASLTQESAPTTADMIPKKMTLGQRILWSRKGLIRTTGLAPLTPEGREKELKLRRTMLVTHQVVGFATLAGMIAQGILGSQLYKAQGDRYTRLKDTHRGVATFINISYGTTALLAFTSPPRLPTSSHRRGFSSIKLHKTLAYVHLAGMIATNVLARQLDGRETIKMAHRAAAFTTFAAFGAAIVAIKF
ncbi:hypothetical protein [Tellurirhabdus rosea]|uniref:hypothetical protein n=1 Tax=Tellurirhabdus rosea TaxID=2674997 RepID=UPI0022598E35|nr:hypothetical protein [Tellurirhabdus rosea]